MPKEQENQPITNTDLASEETHAIEPSAGDRTLSYLYKIALLLALVLIAVAGYFGYLYFTNKDKINNQEQTTGSTAFDHGLNEAAPDSAPGGVLIFTVTDTELPHLMAIDLGFSPTVKQTIEAFPVTAFVQFVNKETPNKVYFDASTVYSAEEIDETGLHSWNIENDEINYYSSAVGSTEKGIDVWKDAELVTFYRSKELDPDPATASDIKNYEVVVIDPKTDTVLATVDGAVHPKWSQGGPTLLYLKSDGIYVYDLSNREEFRVLKINEESNVTTPATMIDVSADGYYVVLTTQGSGSISVLKVNSWIDPDFELVGTMIDNSRWYSMPTISPDSKFYSVLAHDIVNGKLSNQRLEIRGLLSREVVFSYGLDDYTNNQLFVDDWISKGVLLPEEDAGEANN